MSTPRKRPTVARLTEEAAVKDLMVEVLEERLAALELAIEDQGWQRLSGEGRREMSYASICAVADMARTMAIKNPLIKRAVGVQADYVWGQGMSITATHPAVNDVVQAFLDNPGNRAELTGHQARLDKERELQTDGNLFLVLFINQATGTIRVRSIPLWEITRILCNPDDAKEPRYYYRSWTGQAVDEGTGAIKDVPLAAYYPDWRHSPPLAQRPDSIGSVPVRWESPICHIKVGAFSDWRYGLSEIYAATDWAVAYKVFLENWATLSQAYSRWAHKITTKGGAKAVQAIKNRLSTTLGIEGGGAPDRNPPPLTGSTAVLGNDTTLEPIRLSGANVSAEDGRRMLLMVAAAVGFPETFFGDVSVGTLATAESLDRPTELKMRNRQVFWADSYQALLDYVIWWAVSAPRGALRALGTAMIEDEQFLVEWKKTAPDTPETTGAMDIDFPPIVELAPDKRVNAIVTAAPFLPDQKLIARMLLSALGEDDIDELLDLMHPPEGAETTAITPDNQPAVEALRGLRSAVDVIIQKYSEEMTHA